MTQPIILAAGGTGGHLYPAEALAQELLERGRAVVIITDKRGAAFQKLGNKVKVLRVRAATFRPGLLNKLKALSDILFGVVQSGRLLRKLKPALVVGFGGYPSFPPVFAAQQMGYRTLLHEQNAVLGRANLHLAGKAQGLACSLPDTRGIRPRNADRVTLTGNPVRADIRAVRETPYAAPAEGPFNLFITGGSQGARVFGDLVPAALALLPQALRARLRVVHQCPETALTATRQNYRKAGVPAEIKPFFDDMPARLAACHLFIGRSGASTVAEIGVVGRPAIFVPYPGHADQQQKHNAELITQKGGGWLFLQDELTAATLAQKLESLIGNPATLDAAARAARACGQPDAVKKLADLAEQLAGLYTA